MLIVSPVRSARSFAIGRASWHDVEACGGGSGEAEDAQAQAVFAAMLVLFDEAAGLERGDDSGGGRFVHAEFGGDVGDAGEAGAGDDLQDRDRAVDRLHGANQVCCTIRFWGAHSGTITPFQFPGAAVMVANPDRQRQTILKRPSVAEKAGRWSGPRFRSFRPIGGD